MGELSAIKINQVEGDKIELLFYQFQDCMEIRDYKDMDENIFKQSSLLFMYECIKEYEDEFENQSETYPLFHELEKQLGLDEDLFPSQKLSEQFIKSVKVIKDGIDYQNHNNNSCDGMEYDLAFLPEYINTVPHLIIEITLTEAKWATGIEQDMGTYSGLTFLAYEWLDEIED